MDPTSQPLVYRIAAADQVTVELDHHYPTEAGPLGFDLYRPLQAGRHAAVVFVSGWPEPGVVARFGKPMRQWACYQGWARLVAASGMAAILSQNRQPDDIFALVRHLRADGAALGLDPARIGAWACSGHVPTALALLARERLACAALLYGYLLDLDGATAVAEAAAQFHFATPPVSLAELPPELPILLVRAGRDTTPGLEASFQRFLTAARPRLRLTLIEHAEAPHAFDLVDDSPRTREVMEEVLAFLRRALLPVDSAGASM